MFWGTVSPYALPADSAGHTLAALVAAQFTGFLLGVLSAPRLSARIGVGRHIAIALALFAVALSAPLWGLSPPILWLPAYSSAQRPDRWRHRSALWHLNLPEGPGL